MTLQTATPTHGVTVPRLTPWAISIPKVSSQDNPNTRPRAQARTRSVQYSQHLGLESRELCDSGSMEKNLWQPPQSWTCEEASGQPLPIRAPIVSASENAGVNTSLNVPGLVNISSDGEAHSVTIATLCPEAYLVRLSAPKISTQVSLTVSSTHRGSSPSYSNQRLFVTSGYSQEYIRVHLVGGAV